MKLSTIVRKLTDQPHYTLPTPQQAFTFLVSEVGEAADAITSTWPGFIRSEEHRLDLVRMVTTGWENEKIAKELADVVIMASVTMVALGVDPDKALQKKLTELQKRFS